MADTINLTPKVGDIVVYRDNGNDRAALVTGYTNRDTRRMVLRVFGLLIAGDQALSNVPMAASIDDTTNGTWRWP